MCCISFNHIIKTLIDNTTVIIYGNEKNYYVTATVIPVLYTLLVVHKNLSKLANFKALCIGEKGASETTGVRLSYINTLIHRVYQELGWIQEGDIVDGSGSGGELIYGATLDG